MFRDVLQVLQQAQKELLCYGTTGISVMGAYDNYYNHSLIYIIIWLLSKQMHVTLNKINVPEELM